MKTYTKGNGHHSYWLLKNGEAIGHFEPESEKELDRIVEVMNTVEFNKRKKSNENWINNLPD